MTARTTLVSIETINPEQAAKYLATNKNRPPRQPVAREYADEMLAGRWTLDPASAIVFDTNGQLRNGQHRLQGLILANHTAQFVVVRAADPESFDVMDAGAKRSPKDTFAIRGEKYASLLAAAVVWLNRYQQAQARAAAGGSYRVHSVNFLSSRLAEEILDANPGLRDSLHVANTFTPRAILTGALAVWLHYEFAKIDKEMADSFFHSVGEGTDLHKGDPRFALRRLLIENLHSTRKPSAEYTAAVVIRAWNAYIEGRSLQVVAWRPASEPFPTISAGGAGAAA